MLKKIKERIKDSIRENPAVGIFAGMFILILLLIFFMAGLVFFDSYSHSILWRAGYARDVEVFSASNTFWQEKAEYTRSRVVELVRISRELKIFDEKIIPIAIRQKELYGALAEANIDYSIIYIEPIFFTGFAVSVYDEDDIDGLLGHEFAHLVARYNLHGAIWQETCRKLVGKLNASPRAYGWCYPKVRDKLSGIVSKINNS